MCKLLLGAPASAALTWEISGLVCYRGIQDKPGHYALDFNVA
ncbi:hypothetical protein P0Y43_20380 [Pseudomonas entomophila]|nr:hypothetical protein [Pseudomonas entomophila]MDF0733053.1 hypothetical protein [Pseudomonas entomophila]